MDIIQQVDRTRNWFLHRIGTHVRKIEDGNDSLVKSSLLLPFSHWLEEVGDKRAEQVYGLAGTSLPSLLWIRARKGSTVIWGRYWNISEINDAIILEIEDGTPMGEQAAKSWGRRTIFLKDATLENLPAELSKVKRLLLGLIFNMGENDRFCPQCERFVNDDGEDDEAEALKEVFNGCSDAAREAYESLLVRRSEQPA